MINAHFKCRHISQFKDWLMWVTIESERTKKGLSLERDAGSIQTRTPFSHWVISGAVDLGFQCGLYGYKAKT
jgi:hypothetical protein